MLAAFWAVMPVLLAAEDLEDRSRALSPAWPASADAMAAARLLAVLAWAVAGTGAILVAGALGGVPGPGWRTFGLLLPECVIRDALDTRVGWM